MSRLHHTLSRSNFNSHTQTPEPGLLLQTPGFVRPGHWVREWTDRKAHEHTARVRTWVKVEGEVPARFTDEGVIDLAAYAFAAPKEVEVVEAALGGLSAADIRGAVGGSNTLFGSSAATAEKAEEGAKEEAEAEEAKEAVKEEANEAVKEESTEEKPIA